MSFSITFDDHQRPLTAAGRHCGSCQLCCKLLPVRELDKGANTRCRHQSFSKGCKVYHRPGMPISCKLWSCRWLTDEATTGLPRPDRAHYVIDIMPDFVTAKEGDMSAEIEVIQLWVDPLYPEAHRDPALRKYLERLCDQRGAMVLVRYNSESGFCLIPPGMNNTGKWIEHGGETSGRTHDATEILNAVGRIF